MSESLLQKSIGERDLQRMRNLVEGKYGERTASQVGYTKVQEEHVEGDVWTENGKTFTIQNGIKVTLSKLDLVKKTLQVPLTCPKCSKAMKNKQLDTKMYAIHKMCFDCVITYETELRRDGKYEEYAANLLKKSIGGFVSDIESDLNQILRELESSEEVFTEHGESENWKGGKIDKEAIRKDIESYLSHLKSISG